MEERIKLPTGSFSLKELIKIFDAMPAEISFVDATDTVRYFNNKPTRFFQRPLAALNKDMRYCHPKRVLPMVEQLLQDFKDNKQQYAQFWRSDHNGCFISIEYFALRDEENQYMGTLEVVKDITELKKLEGDRDELIYP
jgi:uncharacterized protein